MGSRRTYRTTRRAEQEARAALMSPYASAAGASVALVPASDLPAVLQARDKHRGAPRDVRECWMRWLSPHFNDNEACYFTGTYSDDYGLPNGLMLARNVHKDWNRWLETWGFDGKYIIGVEKHRYRDILHLHAILSGPFTEEQRIWLKRWWSSDRGFARALPVLDGCASYVTKYALKGDTECFEWRL